MEVQCYRQLVVNYLIVGENAGSKLEKSKKLGVEIIEEKDLNDFLK